MLSGMRLFAMGLVVAGCTVHATPPSAPGRDALAGFGPRTFDATHACGDWRHAARGDRHAVTHASFPEADRARSCFVPVRYDSENAIPGPVPEGCGYRPRDVSASLEREAARYEAIAAKADESDGSLPEELACHLPDRVRRAAAAHNARTLRALARNDATAPYAYATIEAFGYGNPVHAGTALDGWMPDDACPKGVSLPRFGVNVDRATRAALAFAGHVAPVVVVSGGAVHSPLVEAFLLDYIATCRIGVPRDRVLLDPCANHTHTNIRNSGALLRAVAGRTAYIVTDDTLQAAYLQEWTLFDLVGGSIDQRSLRDWGYLLGSWRQASTPEAFGFWYTPYRFWADPRLRDFSCVR
jgi:hypothetical protein